MVTAEEAVLVLVSRTKKLAEPAPSFTVVSLPKKETVAGVTDVVLLVTATSSILKLEPVPVLLKDHLKYKLG
jgi:hypothetical protein